MDNYTEIESFLNYLADAILIVDRHTNILFANQSCATLFGYASDEMIKMQIEHLMVPGIQHHAQKVASFIDNKSHAKVMMSRNIMPCINAQGMEFNARISIANIEFRGKECGIATIQDYSSVQAVINDLASEAKTDSLTGLFNKRYLENILSKKHFMVNESSVYGVAYLDLNGFKAINDTFGHDAGDAILVEISKRLKKQLRTGDLNFRLGGDEFLILFSIDDPEEFSRKLSVVGNKIQEVVTAPVYIENLKRKLSVGVSIGLGIVPFDSENLSDLINQADKAMYKSKKNKIPYVLVSDN